MKIYDKKEGHAYLINWLVAIIDLLLINGFFLGIYFLFYDQEINHPTKLTALMLINLSYFICTTFIRIDLSSNIIYFEKIIQRSSYFITLYSIILTAGAYIFKIGMIPLHVWIACFLLLGFLFTMWHIIFRLILKQYRRHGYNYKQVIIIGGGSSGISLYNELKTNDFGYKIIGFFDDNINNKNNLPNYLGKVSDIPEFALKTKIDEIYCTLPHDQEIKIVSLINFSEKHMIRFFLVPEFYRYIKRRLNMRFLHSVPVVSLRFEPLQYLSNRFIKRSFDILFSLLVIIFVFPFLMLTFGIGIKLSSKGPIFFRQKRTGFEGKEFDCLKFRSMRLNTSANTQSATKNDPRVTKIGAIMRKTSIDELPQFINVLKGDMSIVGPRPHMIQHTELYSMLIDRFMVRHLVKPGITGWAQVNGYRGETRVLADMEGRVKKDVWYLENWSFFLDLKIIFVTVVNVFKGEDNAY